MAKIELRAPEFTRRAEEQMNLLWRLADEPILCFDGDNAGQRAAFRAVDLALAHLQPGKSVCFAFLPQGQDPDDLLRSAGAAAVEPVLAAARPLAEVLWMREVAAGPLDTPERRAALERRLRDAVARIGDPLARRHYEADIEGRLEAFTPRRSERGHGARRRSNSPWRGGPRAVGPLGRFDEPRPPFAPSPLLARQPAFSGVNLGAAQEALIVLGLDARHDLLATLVEDLSSLAISDPDARALARALLDGHAFEGEEGTVLSGADLDALRQRLRRKLRPGDGRFLDTAADPEALEIELRQAIGLHDRSRALRSEQCLRMPSRHSNVRLSPRNSA